MCSLANDRVSINDTIYNSPLTIYNTAVTTRDYSVTGAPPEPTGSKISHEDLNDFLSGVNAGKYESNWEGPDDGQGLMEEEL